MDPVHIKERPHPPAGSIPALLDMFRNEVRFYREVAPDVGVRVPGCHLAQEGRGGFRLELEDLSGWTPGTSPIAAARVLRTLHERWEDNVVGRWPWMRRGGEAADEIGALYDRVWVALAARDDLPSMVRNLGESFVARVADLERSEADGGRTTLVHGDASLRNFRTSPDGEVVLLDWEDVRLAPRAVDLAWLLVSSVEPAQWDEVVAASGAEPGELHAVLPTALAQGLLSLADTRVGSTDARSRLRRIEHGATYLRRAEW